MAGRSARWVDALFPHVAVRQWVLTVPWPRRWLLARRPGLARGVHRIAQREIQRWMRRRLRLPGGHGGGVTVLQRFSSDLRLNLHFHSLVLDGLYDRDPRTGGLRWTRAPAPTPAELSALVERLAGRAEDWLARQGFGRDEPGPDEEPDDALGPIQDASIAGRSAVSRRPAARRGGAAPRARQPPPGCAAFEGYNIHAGVVVKARDREGLRRLCSYVLRPPIARERLSETEDGQARIAFKRPWSDGTRAITLSPEELAERLTAIIPPPRANQVLTHGVLGARSRLRAQVCPPKKPRAPGGPGLRLTRTPKPESRWIPWAWLLHHTFSHDPTQCPQCSQPMRLRAVVLPPATFEVLASLDRSARGPPAKAG